MISTLTGRRGCLAASAAAALFVLAGCGGGGQEAGEGIPAVSESPSPTASAAEPMTSPSMPAAASSESPAGNLPVMEESAPEAVRIPSTGTDSELLHLGLRDDGSLDVPPGEPGSPAAWYDKSPTPGERGPAVLLGHVNDTEGGDGVFAGLRDLEDGEEIEVGREDGSVAVFTVDHGEQYSKDDFPTEKVYGNTAGSELRLITCDGFDPGTGLFDDNYVIYAKLVG
jgi:hypothetical protein